MGHIIPYSGGNPAAMAPAAVAPTIAFVQQKVLTTADGSGNVDIAFDAPVASGNSVIACISFLNTAVIDAAPAFIDGDTATLTDAITAVVTGAEVYIYYLHELLTAEQTIRFSLDLPVRASINISEWSGLAAAAPQDTSTGTSVGSTALGVVPATLDPTTNQNLVIGIGGYASTTNTYSSGPSNSFTRLTPTGGASVFQECAYLIRSADHAAVTSDVTLSGSVAWASGAAAFGGA